MRTLIRQISLQHGLVLPLLLALFSGLLPVCAARVASAQDSQSETNLDVRIRVEWQTANPVQWFGSVSLSEGQVSELRVLSLDANAPGSMFMEGDKTVLIGQPSGRQYDGFDVRLKCPPDAIIRFQLRGKDSQVNPPPFEMKVADVIQSARGVSLPTGDTDRLRVQRMAGDALRVDIERPSLVFSPGENFSLSVQPNMLHRIDESKLRFVWELSAKGDSNAIASDSVELTVDESGKLTRPLPVELNVPGRDGVYELNLQLLPPAPLAAKFVPATLPGGFGSVQPLAQRKIQFVVVGEQKPIANTNEWDVVDEIDPSNPKWWERYVLLPKWKWLPDMGQSPIGNGRSASDTIGSTKMVRLAPGGWQAFPLPIQDVGKPHILEIEYPADRIHTLGISILDPEDGTVSQPMGLDMGVDVPETNVTDSQRILKHRIPFWPKGKTPMVMISNQRNGTSTWFGRIRVSAGPDRLPAAGNRMNPNGRLLAAYLDKPILSANFSASEARDPVTGEFLEDWETFYSAADRLVQYLKYVGYNGAVVTIAADGSSIYPSDSLQPTPKFDRGTFFSTGQDPIRKDVVELLFRMFDREGLRLIPAMQFASPLPELEQRKRRIDLNSEGVDLIGKHGTAWGHRHSTKQGLAPYYNPVNSTVQQAIRRSIAEVSNRYSHHASFAGLSLLLGDHTYTQFPGSEWGFDRNTIQQFDHDFNAATDLSDPQQLASRINYLTTSGRELWLQWRSLRLTHFYHDLLADLQATKPNSVLFLSGADMFSSAATSLDVKPTLSSRLPFQAALLNAGISSPLLANVPDIVLLRPQRLSPVDSVHENAVSIEMQTALDVDNAYQNPHSSGSVFFHSRRNSALSQNPSDDFQLARRNLRSHIVPSGYHNRKRLVHSLASLDSNYLFDGGWMLPLGQKDSLASFSDAYTQIPSTRFETVSTSEPKDTPQPMVVRYLRTQNETFLYITNDSPWPVEMTASMSTAKTAQLVSLSGRTLPSLFHQAAGSTWKFTFDPNDLVVARITDPQAQILSWEVKFQPGVEGQLRDRIREIDDRIRAVSLPLDKQRPAPVLTNPSFDMPLAAQSKIAGWAYQGPPNSTIAIDVNNRYQDRGAASLQLTVNGGVLAISSDPFSIEHSGRLTVHVAMRSDPEASEPTVHVGIEGKHRGSDFYLGVAVGKGSQNQLGQQWRAFAFPFNEIPEDLEDIRVSIHVTGEGQVSLDDVRLFNQWFDLDEIKTLKALTNSASYDLEKDKFRNCKRYLDSYWPRLLREQISLNEIREAKLQPLNPLPNAPNLLPSSSSPATATNPPPEEPSRLDKIKDILNPTKWF